MLNMTKIAFGCESGDDLAQRLGQRAAEGDGHFPLPTRYRPKRWAEMQGGSLYWIVHHQIIGRSPLVGFADRKDGRVDIVMEARLIPVEPRARRAHQGWRYLTQDDAPPDLTGASASALATLPEALRQQLFSLGLL